jgi:hypothetical protein
MRERNSPAMILIVLMIAVPVSQAAWVEKQVLRCAQDDKQKQTKAKTYLSG